MSPHTAWLILQGLETLPLRMERHVANARKVVAFLAAHPMVARGRLSRARIASRPRAREDAAAARLRLGLQLRHLRGSRAQGVAFIEALQLFSHLANVGDCRSLVIHPASTTHFRMDDAALAAAGIGPGTIRLSIGLEDADDLIIDLKSALKAAERAAA
jgi:O-acetylhomoserine (thiol)-lyase